MWAINVSNIILLLNKERVLNCFWKPKLNLWGRHCSYVFTIKLKKRFCNWYFSGCRSVPMENIEGEKCMSKSYFVQWRPRIFPVVQFKRQRWAILIWIAEMSWWCVGSITLKSRMNVFKIMRRRNLYEWKAFLFVKNFKLLLAAVPRRY